MEANKLFCQTQHGFVTGRSITTQLLITLDEWTRTLDKGGWVDAIYKDFMKAFDSVMHKRLWRKLEGYGISKNPLDGLSHPF